MEYEIHPAAEIFPLMSGEEFDSLAADIQKHGLREPIVLFEGKVLDGRNRLRACQQLGVEPAFVEWANGEDPRTYVVSKNLHRRHLSESQRAMIAGKMATMRQGERTDLEPSANLPNDPISTSQAAQMLNVGTRTTTAAKKILKEGTPEEIKAVESGKASVSGTEKKITERSAAVNTGGKIAVPDGCTVEKHIRQGMAEEYNGKSPAAIARSLKVAEATYRQIRQIIKLSDLELAQADKEIVATALREIEATRRVTQHFEPVKPIIEKVWGTGSVPKTDARIKRHLAEFERAFGHVIHACVASDRISIPNLTRDRAAEAVEEIEEAQQHLRALKTKLKELCS